MKTLNRSKNGQICLQLVKNYITNYSKNLTTILTIFSINLYTLEDKTMNQRLKKDAAIYSELVSIIERDSDAVYDILEVLISKLNDKLLR